MFAHSQQIGACLDPLLSRAAVQLRFPRLLEQADSTENGPVAESSRKAGPSHFLCDDAVQSVAAAALVELRLRAPKPFAVLRRRRRLTQPPRQKARGQQGTEPPGPANPCTELMARTLKPVAKNPLPRSNKTDAKTTGTMAPQQPLSWSRTGSRLADLPMAKISAVFPYCEKQQCFHTATKLSWCGRFLPAWFVAGFENSPRYSSVPQRRGPLAPLLNGRCNHHRWYAPQTTSLRRPFSPDGIASNAVEACTTAKHPAAKKVSRLFIRRDPRQSRHRQPLTLGSSTSIVSPPGSIDCRKLRSVRQRDRGVRARPAAAQTRSAAGR
jgi:hypothetical protein